MTHSQLIAAWANWIADDGADYMILYEPGVEPYFSIPADRTLVFVSAVPLGSPELKHFTQRGIDFGVDQILVIEGSPGDCYKTLVKIGKENRK
jgi:hypothetical protein